MIFTRQLHNIAAYLAYAEHPASSPRAANTESFPVCATTRKASVRRVRHPHPCEEDAHAPMGSKSPAFKGRAIPLTRDLCNIRVHPPEMDATFVYREGNHLTRPSLWRYSGGKRWSGRLPPHGVTLRQAINPDLTPHRYTDRISVGRSVPYEYSRETPGVESRTGAPTLGSGGGSVAFASGLSPAPIVTFPVPAAVLARPSTGVP